jgi:hypothetical protein
VKRLLYDLGLGQWWDRQEVCPHWCEEVREDPREGDGAVEERVSLARLKTAAARGLAASRSSAHLFDASA